ncbi:MAG: HAMP domain-containing protein, partial [bacterium]
MKSANRFREMLFTFGFPRAWSITLRLTILYSLVTSIVLVSVSGILYWVLARNLAREDNQFLVDKIYVLRTILQERPESIDALKEEVEWEVAARRFEKYYTRILDEQGQVLIETPGMEEIVAPSMFPEPIAANETPELGVKRKGQDGRPFLLMAAWAEVGKIGSKKRLHQVALDVSHEEAILANYRRNMMIMILLGTLFSAVIGVIVTRNGMRPVQQIARAVQRITATQLNERIGPAQWPGELVALAQAFDEMLMRLEDSFARLSQFS